jgi:uncharacterized protein (DUF1800 family)
VSRDTRTPANVWAPYLPDEHALWNLRRVVHLHRRAGFAATWSELQRDLKDGPQASIDRLLQGKARSQGVPADFASIADRLARAAVKARDLGRLKAWWVYRMLLGPDPLGERLTLMWHNHFATSAAKVKMTVYHQNQIFRKYARSPFAELLPRIVRDPALLLYLDAQANRKGNPNENLARELMELFTLGIGPYTEADVKEAARALTGWTLAKGKFHEDPKQHDAGEKTILGHTGHWKGDDLVKMLLKHPATANRLAFRLCELFMGEGAVAANEVRALGQGLREHQLDIGWGVETILRSRAFFADANLGSRVVGPVEFVVGTARALELFDPAPNPLILAEFIANLGQNLFYPPNVGGWPGGRAWIGTRTIIGRCNYAAALADGQPVGRPPLDALGLARRHGRANNPDDAIDFYCDLFLGRRPGDAWRKQLGGVTPRQAVVLILASPEAQLA